MKRLLITITSFCSCSSGRSKNRSNGFLSKTRVINAKTFEQRWYPGQQQLRLRHVVLAFLVLIFIVVFFMYLRIIKTIDFQLPKKNTFIAVQEPRVRNNFQSNGTVSSLVLEHHVDSVKLEAPMLQDLSNNTGIALQNNDLPIIFDMKNDGNIKNNSKLKFVFHIGPVKTGSTTLQRAHAQDKAVLQQDGYLYSLPRLNLAYQCLDHKPNKCEESAKWQDKFLPYLQNHIEENLFLSDEIFGTMADWDGNWNLLQNTIGKTWDLSFIVTYRRFFEWFTSFYFQSHKYGMPASRITTDWPIAANRTERYYSNRIPTIAAFFDLLNNEKNELTSIYVQRWGDTFGKFHPMEVIKSKFEKHYPVKVFNFHQDTNNFVGSFYCNVFPGPQSHACAHHNATNSSKSNHRAKSGSHNYDMLSVAAFDANLVEPIKFQRRTIADKAKSYQETVLRLSANDFPLTCMSSKQLSTLLEMSLRFEKRILPEWLVCVEEHRERFKAYVSEKRFCSINAIEAIRDENWRLFFRSLKSSSTSAKQALVKKKKRLKSEKET